MELMENYNNLEEERLYRKAKKRAQAMRSFYISLSLYCIVIPLLIYINLKYSPEFHWFYFSMIGWGIGLCFHAMEAFNWSPILGKDWEERKIKELLEKEKHNNHKTNNN
jgi:uncharacterized RDD family membrane protein YckC